MSTIQDIAREFNLLKQNKRLHSQDTREVISVLDACFTNSNSDAALQKELEAFLFERWNDIAGTRLSYTYRPKHPVTKLCRSIAVYLHQSNVGLSFGCMYQILMPTVTKTFNLITGKNDLDEYPLDELLISSDLTCLIPANAMQALKQGEPLKRVFVHDKTEEPQVLTAQEFHALANHNPHNQEIYHKFTQCNEIKKVIDFFEGLRNLSAQYRRLPYGSDLAERNKEIFGPLQLLPPNYREEILELEFRRNNYRREKIPFSRLFYEAEKTYYSLKFLSDHIPIFLKRNRKYIDNIHKIHDELLEEYETYLAIFSEQALQGRDSYKKDSLYSATLSVKETGLVHWPHLLQIMLSDDIDEQAIIDHLKVILEWNPSTSFQEHYVNVDELLNLIVEKGYLALFLYCKDLKDPTLSKIYNREGLIQVFLKAAEHNQISFIDEFCDGEFYETLFSTPHPDVARATIIADRLDRLQLLLDKGLNPHDKLPNSVSPFEEAINNSRIDAFEKMFRSEELMEDDLIKHSKEYTQYLHTLIKKENLDFVRWFLKNVSTIQFNLKIDNNNVISAALHWDNRDVIKLLVKKAKSQINPLESESALAFAIWYFAKNNDYVMTKKCLNKWSCFNVYQNEGDQKGFTAIHYAIFHENQLLLDDILECPKANPHATFLNGISAAELAIEQGQTEGFLKILKYDVSHPPENQIYTYKKHLHKAIEKGNLDIVKALLDTQLIYLNSKVNEKTAIEWACEKRHGEIVIALVDKLEQITPAPTYDHFGLGQALCYFLQSNELELAKKCLKPYTNLSHTTQKGYTALHYAIELEDEELLEKILQHHSANPHQNFSQIHQALRMAQRDRDYTYPDMRLTNFLEKNSVEKIPERLKNKLQNSHETKSAAELAMELRNEVALRAIFRFHEEGPLEDLGKIYEGYLKKAIELDNLPLMIELANNPYTVYGVEVLRLAIAKDNPEMVSELLQTARKHSFCSVHQLAGEALLYALSKENINKAFIDECLLAAADLSIAQTDGPQKGYTALHMAIKMSDRALIRALLQQNSVKPHTNYLKTKSAFELALELDDIDTIKAILEFDKNHSETLKETYKKYLHHAIEHNKLALFDLILSSRYVSLQDTLNSKSALQKAYQFDRADMFERLIEKLDKSIPYPTSDAYINLGNILLDALKTNKQNFPYHLCVQQFTNLSNFYTFYSRSGLNKNAYTALHFAIKQSNFPLIEKILTQPNAQPHERYERFSKCKSAAELAIAQKNVEAFQAILDFDKRFPPKSQKKLYTKYFHQAHKKDAQEIMEKLLESKLVNIDEQVGGKSARQIAHDDPNLLKILHELSSRSSRERFFLSQMNLPGAVKQERPYEPRRAGEGSSVIPFGFGS